MEAERYLEHPILYPTLCSLGYAMTAGTISVYCLAGRYRPPAIEYLFNSSSVITILINVFLLVFIISLGVLGLILTLPKRPFLDWLLVGACYLLGLIAGPLVLSLVFLPFFTVVVFNGVLVFSGFSIAVAPLISLFKLTLRSPLVWLLGIMGVFGIFAVLFFLLKIDAGQLTLLSLSFATIGGALTASIFAHAYGK